MRQTKCRLRGKLGGCHPLILLFKVGFFRLCKAPPSIQLRGRLVGCSRALCRREREQQCCLPDGWETGWWDCSNSTRIKCRDVPDAEGE